LAHHQKSKQVSNQTDRNLDSYTGSHIAAASSPCSCHQVWQDRDEKPGEERSCTSPWELVAKRAAVASPWLLPVEDRTTPPATSAAVNGAQKEGEGTTAHI